MKFLKYLPTIISYSFQHDHQYIICNDTLSQKKYLDNERVQFGLIDQVPFSGKLDTTRWIPCLCNSDIDIITNQSLLQRHLIANDPIYDLMYNTTFNKDHLYIIPSLVKNISIYLEKTSKHIWSLLGWSNHKKGVEYYYLDRNSTETLIFFHGCNAFFGLENYILLSQISTTKNIIFFQNPSTYFPYSIDQSKFPDIYHYVELVYDTINDMNLTNITMAGHSYGTILVTLLLKNNPTLHKIIDSVILYEPITINLPYSFTFNIIFNNVFINDSANKTYNLITYILQEERQYKYLFDNLDWYEWTIDSDFLYQWENKTTIYYGLYDSMSTIINIDAPVFRNIKLIGIPFIHGGSLFFPLN